jgi:septal ring factor EnvC (AmiA/AmiB activator)
MSRRGPASLCACLLLAVSSAWRSQAPSAGATAPAAETPSEAAATGMDEKLAHVQERRAALAREVEGMRSQERGLLGDLEQVELAVRLRTEELREAQLVLARTSARLDRTARRLRELTASLDRERPVVAARARALYKLGRLSYLRLLLSVESPAGMFEGYRYVTALARRDNEHIAAFRRDLAALAATRDELAAKTREAQVLRAELDRKRRALSDERARKEAFLTALVARKETKATFLGELEEAETRLRQLLAGLAEAEATLPLVAFKGALPWPAQGEVRVGFGRRRHARFDTYTLQNGIEIAAAQDSPVRAIHDGSIVFADRFLGYGLLVIVDHGGRHLSLYGRLGDASVTVGQAVKAGQQLGTVGPGLEGPALYFEIRSQGRPDDPLDWLEQRTR